MRVHTTKGHVIGTEEDSGVTVFKCIPYAAQPVGELRWAPPREHKPWTKDLHASEFGPACPQPEIDLGDGTPPITNMKEECLYLNVWTTGQGKSDKPVMVWIHGGAFRIGEGATAMYDGTKLAQMGAVVVTFNYRLGHLGFFAHPALHQDKSAKDVPANFGLLDQIAALKWVRDNIAGFGGNSGNVTIFGESAGASSVLALFAAPGAAGLFDKGIAQSPYAIPEYRRDQAAQLGQFVAEHVWGCGANPTLAELRKVDEEMFKQKMFTPPGGVPAPVPSLAPVAVVDHVVLHDKVRNVFAKGPTHPAKLMIGSNSNEQTVAQLFDLNPQILFLILGTPRILEYHQLYLKDPDTDQENLEAQLAGLIMRDLMFTMQSRWTATQQIAAHASLPAYWYYFSYVPALLSENEQWQDGVPHGGEIMFPFQTLPPSFPAKDHQMAAKISEYWFTFARDGVPTSSTAAIRTWPPFTPTSDAILKLGDPIENQQGFRKALLNLAVEDYPKLEAAIEALRSLPPQSRR